MIKRNICVVTSHVPMVFGGHLIIARSLVSALKERGYNSDVIYTPQNRFGRQLSAYLANRLTDVGRTGGDEVVDQIISLRYPSYAVKHPLHVCWLNHRMREYYDLWEDFLGVIPTGKGKLKERFRRRLIQRLDHHLLKKNVKSLYVISGTIKKRLETWGGIPSRVLLPPPPLGRDYHTDSYDNFIFTVSRLHKLKRINLLLDAFMLVRDTDVKCLIAGEGDEYDRLAKRIKDNDLEGRAILLGRVSDQELADYYARCRAVFFGPRNEDFGFVTIEAFRSRKCVITCSDSGGPLDLVEDGVSGFVTRPDPTKIAERIDQLVADPALAERMGQAGYEASLPVTWENVVRTLVKI